MNNSHDKHKTHAICADCPFRKMGYLKCAQVRCQTLIPRQQSKGTT
jgi:hypothetical protein